MDFKENPYSHESFFQENSSNPQMANPFLVGSSSSKGLYQNHNTNFDQVSHTQNSLSSLLSFEILTPFYDPSDPFITSSSSDHQCANLFFPISEPKNPPCETLNYPPRILLQGLSKGKRCQESRQMYSNSLEEFSCLTVEEDKYQAKADFKKKIKKEQPKVSKKGYQNYPILVKCQWTPEEDRLLVQLVNQYGERRWSYIAEMLNGRVGKQCRERWHNHLRPDIKKDIWTEEEEMMLIESHRKIGNKWAAIARKMPGRTENTVKNHWNATKRRLFTTKRRNKTKYNSLLHDYILSLTSSNHSSKSEHTNHMTSTVKMNGSDHCNKTVYLGRNNTIGLKQVFDEMSAKLECGAKDMDLLEMVYQGRIRS